MKIALILGTRPEIIKMSPLIRELDKRNLDYFILHTGQHYDYEMDREFFEELDLPEPKYNLSVGRNEYRKQIGLMVQEISKILIKEKPDIAFVQGDTNSVLAGALAANKTGIKIAHHEAGLRSHDLSMLEETNRIITDHISDYLFAPTKNAVKNLKEEGLGKEKIFLTGNTIVDAIYQNIQLASKKNDILKKLYLKKGNYILVTAHRAENVDIRERLEGVLEGIALVGQYLKMPAIYPLHPRTSNNIKKFKLKIKPEIKIIEPLGYLEFLQLEANSKLIITDSGGLQEEASILKVPCVTVRDNTERPETIEAGINILAGAKPKKILKSAKLILKKQKNWPNLFGDGHAAEKILDKTEALFKKRKDKIRLI
ncbi:MAG: UDP-N-acetylglucosamine 2-epimerase [Candidatus Portnoybacteria bacterium RBG_19FT_COMBO_36_7]|uniref:UDP-N-acetylglucosamine 2-epimerase n=1 Tax=Candidatus Portnoybacteria bacterium RBG_19FT_COMBO_36_7 TaxID=1801992 RepID=A0A1G2F841_9BACT|nr:MAG: UDP-N-acetylglucosamine 2-epimerase [Candidatus Portnoybacteria bacterium RBG_19FT_COMBO_36_7]